MPPAKEDKSKNQTQKQGEKNDAGKKKGGGKKKKSKKGKCQPGMSFLCEPCPHRVYTPKPGEREKSEPRGAGSPWYVKTRKKEEIDKEEEEKSKKKESAAAEKRKKAADERKKKKEEEEKKKEEKKKKREERKKEREEKRKQKEKEKKKQENEKRKKQEEQRKERKQKEEEEKKEGKKKEKTETQPSYMYEPCPHRVYTPGPGEKDMADPKGVGSPWYVKTVKKEELDKEEEEKQEKDKEKFKEDRKRRQKEKKEKEKLEAEEKKKEEEEKAKADRKVQRKLEKIKKEKEIMKEKKKQEDIDHEDIGQGVRESKTDFRPELKWMMDFIRDVDEQERERRGDSLRWKKEEIEEEIESHMAKEAFTSDFKTLIQTFVEAEWSKADDKLKKLEKDERRRRRKVYKEMEPLARDMMAEGKRTDLLYRAAMGKKKGSGEGKPTAMEDMVIGMIMQQIDHLAKPREDILAKFPFSLM